ncbi:MULTISPECIES: hypothetical protein [unclassified Bradyrhizobium]|uniref:hypothetical protein n=1 Tax=unclassified Bradyrhizobium TaxID=2631580 RepID=UPI001FF8499D|nr:MULTISPECIES: hypothetical protein [unclassified Bradyrhizobium]MCK1781019.1 hypothetical protein [Bradyrhizobium sp. 132]
MASVISPLSLSPVKRPGTNAATDAAAFASSSNFTLGFRAVTGSAAAPVCLLVLLETVVVG